METFLLAWALAAGIGGTGAMGYIGAEYSHKTYHQRIDQRIERVLKSEEAPKIVPKEANIPWLTEQSLADYKAWKKVQTQS